MNNINNNNFVINPYNVYYNNINKGSGQIDKTATNGNGSVSSVKSNNTVGKIECETCNNRTYQDGSNDPGVSFKTPTHIDPIMAGSAVMSHEMEHVAHEQTNAKMENREVVSQSVSIHTSICPECGRVYVSGGTTKTTTATKNDDFSNDYMKKMSANEGLFVDKRV